MKQHVSLAIIAASAFAASAHADIVHFTNPAPGEPGYFVWHGAWEYPRYLDITVPAAAQSNEPTGNSVMQVILGFPTGGVWGMLGSWVGEPSNLARVGGVVIPPYDDPEVLPLENGDPLAGLSYLEWGFYAYGYPPSQSPFPLGQRRFVGVLTMEGRYGWIEVEREGLDLRAVSWAYETEPGVPILAGQIPTPGALAVLALSALTSTRRRRS